MTNFSWFQIVFKRAFLHYKCICILLKTINFNFSNQESHVTPQIKIFISLYTFQKHFRDKFLKICTYWHFLQKWPYFRNTPLNFIHSKKIFLQPLSKLTWVGITPNSCCYKRFAFFSFKPIRTPHVLVDLKVHTAFRLMYASPGTFVHRKNHGTRNNNLFQGPHNTLEPQQKYCVVFCDNVLHPKTVVCNFAFFIVCVCVCVCVCVHSFVLEKRGTKILLPVPNREVIKLWCMFVCCENSYKICHLFDRYTGMQILKRYTKILATGFLKTLHCMLKYAHMCFTAQIFKSM